MKKYRPVSLKKIKTYPLKARASKVELGQFAAVHEAGSSFAKFLEGLPGVLSACDFRDVASAVIKARRGGRPVVLGMGAHPLKVGLSPVIIDLMERGVVTALATNGAAVVHDFELALAGRTSEDVAHALADGSFGMARETGKFVNEAINRGVRKGHGIGKSMGLYIENGGFRFRKLSVFAAGERLGLPVTVHVAIGTDIVHMHPGADGAAIGEGSMRDFRLFAAVVGDLEGGVYINLGSAVVLPEVFLKALSVARNLRHGMVGHGVEDFTTVSMDFIQHYRVRENVLKRPTMRKGRSYALTGHHEIMFPLLAASVIEGL